MKNKLKKLISTLALTVGLSVTANASLFGVEDHGNYFTDTTNGLDWLDVTLSVNRIYADVSQQFGVGGDFAGWQFATYSQLVNMVESTTTISTGITAPNLGYHTENELFVDLISSGLIPRSLLRKLFV